MTANPEPPPMMDLSGFTDPDTSLALAARGCPKAYTAIAKRHMVGREHVTMPMMLFGSFVSRMRGLHEAILREIEANNPHGAFPLLRAWAEVVALAIYVLRSLPTSTLWSTIPETVARGARVSPPSSTPSGTKPAI